ncbi:MAG: hypothetical protein IIB16_05250 [Chloroflexi bacterium]|nr:hypothetical protein [Chloroflexota bacterium]
MTGLVQATSLGPTSVIDSTGQGLTIAEAGVGLEALGTTGSEDISITIGGPVQQAVLYWAGRKFPCDQDGSGNCVIPVSPYGDQVLMLDGNTITGDVIGSESQLTGGAGQAVHNIGYAADVTAIVQAKVTSAGAGIHVFTIEDGDTENNLDRLNGAGLLVLYTNLADGGIYRVQVFSGLDFAFGRSDQVPAAQVTEPIIFNLNAADEDRIAEVIIFAGDATLTRPDRIDVTVDGTTDSIFDALAGADGPGWDTLTTNVNVPSNSNSVTVQLFSAPFGQNPDSLLWTTGAIRIPVPGSANARITGGGWRVTGSNGESIRVSNGLTLHCDITLSNNLQINWDGGSKWHINKFVDAAFCLDDPDFTPEPPDSPADTYVGVDVGKLNNSSEAVACFILEDHGEVKNDPDGPDRSLIRIWKPGTAPALADFDLSGPDPCKVDSSPPTTSNTVLYVPHSDVNGNLQFHFDQPHKGN